MKLYLNDEFVGNFETILDAEEYFEIEAMIVNQLDSDDNNILRYELIADAGNLLTDDDLHDRYDNFIDEISDEVKIMGLTYQASAVLKEVDPTAYRCGFADWLDGELQSDNLIEFKNEYYTK